MLFVNSILFPSKFYQLRQNNSEEVERLFLENHLNPLGCK